MLSSVARMHAVYACLSAAGGSSESGDRGRRDFLGDYTIGSKLAHHLNLAR